MTTWCVRVVLALFLAGAVGSPATADVSGRMQNVFDNLGAYGSVDGPRYVAAQSRHVFSGGGITYRAPRQTYQLFSATGPSLNAGCGGIDLYAGAFSFINKDQFIQMLNNIAANSIGLAFKTALCSTSANLCQAIEDLQRTIQSHNRFNIDSCEAAKRIVGGFMGAAEQSAQAACQANSWYAGLAGDASEARQMCANQTDYDRSRNSAAAGDQAANQPIEFVGGNLTWQVLAEIAGGLDVKEREFLQSMLGTHVATTVTLSLQYYPPTVTALAELNEREVFMLTCDEPVECLTVTPMTVTLTTSFLELAQTRLLDMRDRILRGEQLTDEQINLVAGAPIPVLAMVQADAAGAAGLVDIAAEAIGYAAAHHFLTTSLREAASTASAWKSRSVNEAELVHAMVDDSRKLRNELASEMHVALTRVNDMIEIGSRVRSLRHWMAGETLAPLTDR